MHLKKNNGFLVIRGIPFHHAPCAPKCNGKMVNESLGAEDNPANVRVATTKMRRIRREILESTFDFAKWFPNSRHIVAPTPVKTPTLREYAPDWLSAHALKVALVEETRQDYDAIIKAHILTDPIAGKLMPQITEDDLAAFVGRVEAKMVRGKKLGPRRINRVIATLRTMFGDACRKRLDDGTRMLAENPASFVDKRRAPKPIIDPFDYKEARAIIDKAEGWFKTYLTIALFAGLRPSEILALKWDDIDRHKSLIMVRRTTTRSSGMRPPKTASSERDVDMVDLVRNAIAEQRTKTGMSKSGLIFPSEADTPMWIGNVRDREWNQLVLKAKVRRRPMYQCRHSFAAISLTRGDDVRYVAQQLGHSTIAMVVNVYSRWMPLKRGGTEPNAPTATPPDSEGTQQTGTGAVA